MLVARSLRHPDNTSLPPSPFANFSPLLNVVTLPSSPRQKFFLGPSCLLFSEFVDKKKRGGGNGERTGEGNIIPAFEEISISGRWQAWTGNLLFD